MRTVSVLNYKGGVGKTTLSACTGQALALTGFRVLTIDNDPQHNLSYMLGANIDKPTIRDVYQAPTIGTAARIFTGAPLPEGADSVTTTMALVGAKPAALETVKVKVTTLPAPAGFCEGLIVVVLGRRVIICVSALGGVLL